MEATVVKNVPTNIMGEDVKTNATVITMYNSVIMCGDAYKGQKQQTTSQPTTNPRILSKRVFFLLTPALTPALIVEVGILYLDNDEDEKKKKRV